MIISLPSLLLLLLFAVAADLPLGGGDGDCLVGHCFIIMVAEAALRSIVSSAVRI